MEATFAKQLNSMVTARNGQQDSEQEKAAGLVTQLSITEKMIGSVQQSLCELRERLAPVLRPDDRDGIAGECLAQLQKTLSPVAANLQSIQGDLSSLDSQLQDLLQRLHI